MSTSTRQPDILEVIADLSNDEVFTPPKIASQVLDLLPDDVWNNPELRFLDPGTKTGVFLREITKRLMVGLADTITDDKKRLEHILTNQVYGVAITELTALMSRRTLYCSKDASGAHSAAEMSSSGGNIWFQRIEHTFVTGRCQECGAPASSFDVDESKENYAYGFIHAVGLNGIKEELGMKFDVIVGNPPYQIDSDGGNRTLPIYNLFVEQAKSLNPDYLAMIVPSRWMAGGLGLNNFRQEMLADSHIRHIVDFPNASEVFPGVEIKGGVCYFLRDGTESGSCAITSIRGETRVGPTLRALDEFDVLVRDSRALSILRKVLASEEGSITEILSADKEFGWTSNFDDFRKEEAPGLVRMYYNRQGKRLIGGIARTKVEKSPHLINKWKVLVPKAGSDGGQRLPDVVLGTPLIASPPSVCTQTYLFFFTDSKKAAVSIHSYIRTRFVRFLVSLRKMTQDATRSTYKWVPPQTWDRTWTDEELYKKYKITKDEQAYIAEMIKEMPAS